jgi:ATP-dependent helicase HrpB
MLPIEDVLPQLCLHLRTHPNLVLVAPPGAGKTTMVAPALLREPWCEGQILLLSPRRLAARAAAERMAELCGQPVGASVGYMTRLDSKHGAATRILVLTEGIFRNRIQSDPELSGISAVIFDEVHERSLDSDFGLALALDVQSALRPDLRLIAMSATLDGERFASIMDAPVLVSEGRSFPLTLRHIGRRSERRLEEDMADAIQRALAEADGGCLAFLPGVAEIERTAQRLDRLPPNVELHRLHGTLDPVEQRAAIMPARDGVRKLVLATSIAETSLTLDGIRIVIDSGLARRARYDRAAGVTRLVTERASQASVTQRAGRAARQGPGIAYRLWEESATSGLPPYDPPEICEADLSAVMLEAALWGVRDPRELKWLDPPAESAIAEAQTRLGRIGALDDAGRPTPHGRAVAVLPLPPRLAHMLIEGAARGSGQCAADAAVLLAERGLGGNDIDLDERRLRWHRDKGKRAAAARGLARRWRQLVPGIAAPDSGDMSLGGLIALAFPDRVARRRDASGEAYASVGGRGFRLDPASSLARHEWLAVAETQGAAAGARILSAAALSWSEVESLFPAQIISRKSIRFDPARGTVDARIERRLGALMLASGHDSDADPGQLAAALVEGVRSQGLSCLVWPTAADALRNRAAFAGHTILDDEALLDDLDSWFAPLAAGKRKLSEISPQALLQALETRLGWTAQRQIDSIAPTQFLTPAGTRHDIDYSDAGGPSVTVRVQALFGLTEHPCVGADRTPVRLTLTSPAGRPIQMTQDLPGFWAGSWRDVAKQMRGEYPKHNWPDNPAAAFASLKTKKAQSRT